MLQRFGAVSCCLGGGTGRSGSLAAGCGESHPSLLRHVFAGVSVFVGTLFDVDGLAAERFGTSVPLSRIEGGW